MTQVTIYPDIGGSWTPAQGHHIAVLSVPNRSISPGTYLSWEQYLTDHATEQTIERILSFEVEAEVNAIAPRSNMDLHAAIIMLTGNLGDFSGTNDYAGDVSGIVDSVAAICTDNWAMDVLSWKPLSLRTSATPFLFGARLSGKYTVPSKMYDNNFFTSDIPASGVTQGSTMLIVIHDKASDAFPTSTYIGIRGTLSIRKSIVFNNDSLVNGVF